MEETHWKTFEGSIFQPFYPGQVLELKALKESGADISSSLLHVEVIELHPTPTQSCPLTVHILTSPGERKRAFLKLYDRRFAVQSREDEGLEPWSVEVEQKHANAVITGEVGNFLRILRRLKDYPSFTMEDWESWGRESFVGVCMAKMYKSEAASYRTLRELQGDQIPRLLASVDLDLTPTGIQDSQDEGVEHFHVKGILLEYIEGFDLRQMPDRLPQHLWQELVDDAVAVVHAVSDHDILNADVRPENFLVSKMENGRYRVCMIDQALCRFRGPKETDEEWKQAKYDEDEEGMLGYAMQKILDKHYNFRLDFVHSGRYLDWM